MSEEHRILKEISKGLKDFTKKDKENREYLKKLREDLKVEEMNFKMAKNIKEVQDHQSRDEIISQIEASVFAIGELIRITQAEIDQLEVERMILRLRKKAAEEIL